MPNVVVTSTADLVKFVFNGQHKEYNTVYARRSGIDTAILIESAGESYIHIDLAGGEHFDFSTDGNVAPIVDTVDGVAPSSDSDLLDKLSTLIKV